MATEVGRMAVNIVAVVMAHIAAGAGAGYAAHLRVQPNGEFVPL
eukprot:SAG31_NODE_12833_length_913_cov_1.851351_1_plen_43_part_10